MYINIRYTKAKPCQLWVRLDLSGMQGNVYVCLQRQTSTAFKISIFRGVTSQEDVLQPWRWNLFTPIFCALTGVTGFDGKNRREICSGMTRTLWISSLQEWLGELKIEYQGVALLYRVKDIALWRSMIAFVSGYSPKIEWISLYFSLTSLPGQWRQWSLLLEWISSEPDDIPLVNWVVDFHSTGVRIEWNSLLNEWNFFTP